MSKKKGPFDMGEVRESKGTSPIPHRLYGRTGDVSDTEVMELDMRDETYGARTIMTPAGRASGSAWELRRVDPSPVSTVVSVTPKAGGRDRASISPMYTPLANQLGYNHGGNTNDYPEDRNDPCGDRQSLSPTPRPVTSQDHNQDSGDEHSHPNIYDNMNTQDNDDTYNWPNDQDWGDDAMMVWDATSGRDEDASSVDPEEAGVLDGDDDDDDWGKDAMLAWDNYDDDDDFTDHNDDFSAAGAPMDISSDDAIAEEEDDVQVEETEDELVARGMPSYRDWTIKDLQVCAFTSNYVRSSADVQKLCSGYGYRPITKHDALVDLAIQCWRAIHPPAPRPKLDFRAPSRSSSISSADMPLSRIREAKGTKGAKPKSKILQTGKGKRVAPLALATSGPPPEDLSDRFLSMIRNDSALWLRILRYEVSYSHRIQAAEVVQTLTTHSADQL